MEIPVSAVGKTSRQIIKIAQPAAKKLLKAARPLAKKFVKKVGEGAAAQIAETVLSRIKLTLETDSRPKGGIEARAREIELLSQLRATGSVSEEQFRLIAARILAQEPALPVGKRLELFVELNKLRTKGLLSDEQYQSLVDVAFRGKLGMRPRTWSCDAGNLRSSFQMSAGEWLSKLPVNLQSSYAFLRSRSPTKEQPSSTRILRKRGAFKLE